MLIFSIIIFITISIWELISKINWIYHANNHFDSFVILILLVVKIYSSITEEVEKLKYRFVITTTLTCFSLFGMLYLLGRTLIRWKRIQHSLQTVFRRNIRVKVRIHKNRRFLKAYSFILRQILYWTYT